ncbi:hypothetical protein V8G54_030284 [Vigna mungo]|uniref:Putative plant transposon protein domain-containing protein n=1 Tax=Vigna mungo TaxID=3915 RepID=A0AAQ3RJY4_VIGMU
MAEPVRRTRRRRSYGSESTPAVRGPNIHGWISDEDLHPTYLQRWKERRVLRHKFATINWLQASGFQISHMLMEQGIQHLLELQGRYYPDLVRVFYYNLKTRDGIAYSKVKGVDIALDYNIWTNVAQLPIFDDALHVPNDFAHFNRILTYRSFLRNPAQDLPNMKHLLVGPLKMEERLLHYLLVWILCPRGTNLAQCSELDLMIMSAITQHRKINWPSLIIDTIVRAIRYDRASLPYPLLISKILEYRGVDVTGEECVHVLPSNKIGESTLRQMGIILQGDHYVFAEEVGAPVNEDVDEDDQEAQIPDPTNVAGSSQPPPQYSLESISRQIEMMATMQQTRMDEMMAFHNRRYDEITSHLREIDSKLAKMYIPDSEDES